MSDNPSRSTYDSWSSTYCIKVANHDSNQETAERKIKETNSQGRNASDIQSEKMADGCTNCRSDDTKKHSRNVSLLDSKKYEVSGSYGDEAYFEKAILSIRNFTKLLCRNSIGM